MRVQLEAAEDIVVGEVCVISFVIPAHNEEAALPATLQALLVAARATGREFEIVVVDDASTDATTRVAEALGARVERVNLRHIAAVRNAGARVARGEVLVFVDADTLVGEHTLRAALAALDGGAVGGGATVRLDPQAPAWGRIVTSLIAMIWFRLHLAAGCFVFARRGVFERVGGFDEKYFLGEEMYVSKALKRQGRFVIVPRPVITSARKFRTYSPQELFGAMTHLLGRGPRSWKSREGARWWYEGRREVADRNWPARERTDAGQ